MIRLKAGDPAPPFTLSDQQGEPVSLGDFGGQPLLIYFYPRADTPGCTTQACSLRDHRADLQQLGVAVVGISPDSPQQQRAFATKHQLGFPLLSDVDHAVAEAYGAYGEKKLYGKTSIGILRSAFLIDGKGRILDAWYKVKPEATYAKAEAALKDR